MLFPMRNPKKSQSRGRGRASQSAGSESDTLLVPCYLSQNNSTDHLGARRRTLLKVHAKIKTAILQIMSPSQYPQEATFTGPTYWFPWVHELATNFNPPLPKRF